LALAVGAHLLVFGLIYLILRPALLPPPPDQPLINMVMESAPAPAPPPPAPATPAQPVAPPLPLPPPPPAPKPSEFALPPPLPAPRPAHRPAPARVPVLAVHAAPSPPRMAAPMSIATIPAKPDPNSNNPPPDYPQLARDAGEQGQVLLSIHVMPDGQPGIVTIKQSSGYKLLDDAARQAVAHWHFYPALKAGQPANSVLPYWISFQLQ
jgi:protein TonB